MNISGVRSCYDEGKRVAETLMFDYHRQHGIGKNHSTLKHGYVSSANYGLDTNDAAPD